jgi:beta-ribofuranosylaminobenzene 5'-phosphate synthase
MPTAIPPVLIRTEWPSDWVVALLASGQRGFNAEKEAAFFLKVLPLPDSEATAAISLAYHGLAPALLDGDLMRFAHALHDFQSRGLKAKEIEAQSMATRECLEQLRRVGAVASGLSSVGPLIFAICRTADVAAVATVEKIARSHELTTVWTRGHNAGFVLAEPER